ncbi:MAG: hypothetical protein D6734_09290 [Candidatus Schekmanbacteria bacterium]|nr:MAG: hypothetical protein D6734_09290 [Candidatus Schekmanbacteria bacterium]
MKYKKINSLIFNLTLGRIDEAESIVKSAEREGMPIDWEALVDLAAYHGVASIIYKNIKDIKPRFVDNSFLSEIESYYYGIAGKNTNYFAEMDKILLTLNDSGVDTILLKGAALGETVYNNIALRPIEDIDLLVKRFDFPAAKAAFKRWGYDVHEKIFPSRIHKEIEMERHKPFEKYESELHFFDKKNRFFFDIHWNLLIVCESGIAEAIQLNMDKIWQRIKEISTGEAYAYTMSDEDNLIYLCLHLRERHFEKARSRLIWWYDVYMLLKQSLNTLDCAYFLNTVSEYGAEKSVFSIIKTVKTLFGIELPKEIDDAIGDDIETFELNKLIPEPTDQIKYQRVFVERDYLAEIKNIKGITKKIRILIGDIFPDSRYMVSYYRIENKALLPLYYLIRFKNVLIKGLKAANQLIKNNQ